MAPPEAESPRLATPDPGDEVLFSGTGDGGPRSGIVEGVGDAGEVRFRFRRGEQELRAVLNLRRPDVRRAGGRILNSYLRVRRKNDPPDARYLAGELLVGFRVGSSARTR